MKKLVVNTKNEYEIIIDTDIIDKSGSYIRNISDAKKAAVITDSNVSKLYLDRVMSSLNIENFETSVFTFKAGEGSKNLTTINNIYNHLCENNITRSDIIIALGGGVTGDMAGFAAATYLRGIDFAIIPTSLLSQIDSSVGGKTGVDNKYGKNLIGAFHQPKIVIIDPNVLNTLPQYYWNDGMAEVIKYGCIKSKSLFEKLRECNPKSFLEDMIYECINIKKSVVERDEFDKGERMLLNFGHTVGHALEKNYEYKKLSHGQAVAIGMAMITKASETKGLSKKGSYEKVVSLLKKYSLPIDDPTAIDDIISCAIMDKKNMSNKLNIILIKEIGESFIHSLGIQEFKSLLEDGDSY